MFKQFFASLNASGKPISTTETQPEQAGTIPVVETMVAELQDKPAASPEPSLPAHATPWTLPTWQAVFLASFALTVGLILFLRLFQLDTLQTEIYGDIDIVFQYMNRILAGQWPVQFELSAGPLYHYLIAPVVLVTKLNYPGLKLASVVISLAGLAATYAFSRRIVNDNFALLVLFIAGVSSWLLVFSRLGNSQIVLPLLTMTCLWLIVRIIQFGQQRDVVACAMVSCLGFFAYPQSFVLPGVMFLTILCLRWTGQRLPQDWITSFMLACIPWVLLFGWLVNSDIANFTQGYIGGKIRPEEGYDPVSILGRNIVNSALALHVRGDDVFRSNPLALPHLDWVSGILFLGGIGFWLVSPERRRWTPLWLIPLIGLQVPSILVLSQVAEVPSASRTLGVSPIVYFLVASGLWWLARLLSTYTKRWVALSLTVLLLGGILYLNVERYFKVYIEALPYANIPIGHSIAKYANSLPDHTQVYIAGCCWEYGMPESFLGYDMVHPENLHYFDLTNISCAQLNSLPVPGVVIWSFYDDLPTPRLEPCKEWLPAQLYYYQGKPVFNAAPLRRDLGSLTSIPDGPPVNLDEILAYSEIELDGQMVEVEYSPIDMGSIGDLFDGDPEVLMRGESANPMVVVLKFSQPREINSVELTVGSMPHFQVTVIVTYQDNSIQTANQDFQNLPDDPQVSVAVPESDQLITSIRVLVEDMNRLEGDEGDYHIHLRELQLK